jgi:hypothetical protein
MVAEKLKGMNKPIGDVSGNQYIEIIELSNNDNNRFENICKGIPKL